MPLNVNIGVLGHVDSGKTSLSKALSTQASTASFDKNPQSQERGITLDLGFSTFSVSFVDDEDAAAVAVAVSSWRRLPKALAERWGGPAELQFTLVDCPGHASLIKTVIGGAQIIDAVMLVVDATKGIQTQTAECLVLAEIVCSSLVLVVNKIDLLPEAERERSLDRLTKRLLRTLAGTRFADCPVAAVAASPAVGDVASASGEAPPPVGLANLVKLLVSTVPVPTRSPAGPMLFSVDHCFGIRGQGTVLTGTLLSGCVRVGDTVEVAHEQRRVKGMQIFRKPVDYAQQGDRLGLCVTQLDPRLLERGLVYAPGSVPTIHALVLPVSPVPHYKLPVRSKAKLHVSLGHDTAMASLLLFRAPEADKPLAEQYCEYVEEASMKECPAGLHALLEFERPVQAPPSATVIVSKLDVDINQNVCRIAMHGRPLEVLTGADYRTARLPKLLRVYRPKSRRGRLDRVKDAYTIVVTGLFRKETNLDAFIGLQVSLSTGQAGRIEGSFGQSGKCTVRMSQPLADDFCQRYGGSGKRAKGGGSGSGPAEPVEVCLSFKRLLFDPLRKMTQT